MLSVFSFVLVLFLFLYRVIVPGSPKESQGGQERDLGDTSFRFVFFMICTVSS